MKVNILGIQISNLRKGEVLSKIREYISNNEKRYIVTPNPEFVMDAQKDELFKSVLNKADIAIPDGAGLIFASWYILHPLKQRIHGVDLVWDLIESASQYNWSIYLLGGEEGITKELVAEEAVAVVKEKYPKLTVNFYNQNFIYSEASVNDHKAVEEINKVKPDILLVAFGHKKQEKWIARNLNKLDTKVSIGVGGTFDYISGKIKRAPKFIRSLRMEWLYRLFKQPSRGPRIYKAFVKFVSLVIIKAWKYR